MDSILTGCWCWCWCKCVCWCWWWCSSCRRYGDDGTTDRPARSKNRLSNSRRRWSAWSAKLFMIFQRGTHRHTEIEDTRSEIDFTKNGEINLVLASVKNKNKNVSFNCGLPLLDWKRDSAENGCGAALETLALDETGGKGAANRGGGNDECDVTVECNDDAIDPGGGVGFVIVFVIAGDNCALLELKNTKK